MACQQLCCLVARYPDLQLRPHQVSSHYDRGGEFERNNGRIWGKNPDRAVSTRAGIVQVVNNIGDRIDLLAIGAIRQRLPSVSTGSPPLSGYGYRFAADCNCRIPASFHRWNSRARRQAVHRACCVSPSDHVLVPRRSACMAWADSGQALPFAGIQWSHHPRADPCRRRRVLRL